MMLEFDLDGSTLNRVRETDRHDEAAAVLISVFEERACEEALMRAVVAERGGDRTTTKFWVSVYSRLSGYGHH